jgi:hypothetical protein
MLPVAFTGFRVGAAEVGETEGDGDAEVGDADVEGSLGEAGLMVSTGFGLNGGRSLPVHAAVLTTSAVPRTTATALPQRAARTAATLFA